MEPIHNHPQQDNAANSFFQSGTAKIIMVGLLTLILLIPLQYVKTLIWERSDRQKEVVEEINDKWGGSVYFYGPIIKVPYTLYEESRYVDAKTSKVTVERKPYTEYAYFFPEDLKANINVKTEEKNRANYESAVFSSQMAFKGSYAVPDFSSRKIAAEDIRWDNATVIIRTNNIKGIKGAVSIKVGNSRHAFEPVMQKGDTISTLETRPFSLNNAFTGNRLPFDFNISYNGSEQIKIVPIGKLTEATMASNWHSPSFTGNFLPEKKNIAKDGFTASWNVSYLNRAFASSILATCQN